jgi:hypothetical protein
MAPGALRFEKSVLLQCKTPPPYPGYGIGNNRIPLFLDNKRIYAQGFPVQRLFRLNIQYVQILLKGSAFKNLSADEK